MPAKDPKLYLIHIRDCCLRVMTYTSSVSTNWMASPIVLDAVCRNLEIIGEAASKLEEPFRKSHPGIPWRSMINARNVLIHAYDQLKPELLQDIVESDIPKLLSAIRAILGEDVSATAG